MMRYRSVTVNGDKVKGEESFDGGKNWFPFRASMKLLHIQMAMEMSGQCASRIWNLQDGYGSPGLFQGDWSGIRDSSKRAKQEMYKVAKLFMSKRNVLTKLTVDERR
jgi:hypothetical protein